MNVAIIGSGLAGVAACSSLTEAGIDSTIYEASPYWGGHTHSEIVDGFTFDEGPHVSFTTDERVRQAFLQGAGELEEFAASISNYFHGAWLTHPAQCHLHGLDPDLITRCIVDFVSADRSGAVDTYADWLVATYGATFAETFPFVYTRKYWTVDAGRLGTDWVGPRMYPPKLEEVVRGALGSNLEGAFHYLKTFRYPARGGYQAFMHGLVRPERIQLGKEVVGINPGRRLLTFSDGTDAGYDRLISTMPLPELVGIIGPGAAPLAVREASAALLCTSVALVDLAVERPDLSPHHWFYVYDDDIAASRVHFPHRLAQSNAPSGRGSVQAEVYFSRHRPLPSSIESLTNLVVEDLVRMGILAHPSEVLWGRTRVVPYANIVFDHGRAVAVDKIRRWIEGLGIELAGRYGEWGYHWTDDATRSGWNAAERVLAEQPEPA
jgi:protoporphyrinogen oxidase